MFFLIRPKCHFKRLYDIRMSDAVSKRWISSSVKFLNFLDIPDTNTLIRDISNRDCIKNGAII